MQTIPATFACGTAELKKRMDLPIRETLEADIPNIVNDSIASRERSIFPQVHIKLGLMKHLASDRKCFKHTVSAFIALIFQTIKACVFDVPQIPALLCDHEFVRKMNNI